MAPDVLVLCVIVVFGVNVGQRVWHVIRQDPHSGLRSIYHRTGLLLDIIILGLQAFGRALASCLTHCQVVKASELDVLDHLFFFNAVCVHDVAGCYFTLCRCDVLINVHAAFLSSYNQT